jgi:hypothetical protein
MDLDPDDAIEGSFLFFVLFFKTLNPNPQTPNFTDLDPDNAIEGVFLFHFTKTLFFLEPLMIQ